MKSVKWAAAARRDIERIRDIVAPETYPEIVHEIVVAARFIASTPKAGPAVGSTFSRKWPVKRYPYLLIYRPLPDDILISRVVHTASDWKPLV